MQQIPSWSIDNPTAGGARYDVFLSVDNKITLIRTFAKDSYHAIQIAMGVAGYKRVNPEFRPFARRIE